MKKIYLGLPAIVLCLIGMLAFTKVKNVNAGGGNFSEKSIIPADYRDEGDCSKYLFDRRFATMTASTIQYIDGKVYILLYNNTYKLPGKKPENYYIQAYIRYSNGYIQYLEQADRANMLNDWSDVKNIEGVDVHKTFDYKPVEISGAAPKKPEINFRNEGNYGIDVDFSGSCDWSHTTYSFDYYSINKYTHKQGYVADEYTILRADDYLTGFYYTIDENSNDTAWSESWSYLGSNDYSGNTNSLSLSIPSQYVNTDKTYYIHTVARSYTGAKSEIVTKEIPRRGVHTVRFDCQGGSGNFRDLIKIYGKSLNIHSEIPTKPGMTFTGWIGEGQEPYSGGDPYTRDQDGGEYLLKAAWRNNIYRINFHSNEKNGDNGRVNGDMKSIYVTYFDKGLPQPSFTQDQNHADWEDYELIGFDTDPDALRPFISISEVDSFYEISKLIDKCGLTGDGEIDLYAIWNKRPLVRGEKTLYLTEEEWKSVSEESLLRKIEVIDREDGSISYKGLLDSGVNRKDIVDSGLAPGIFFVDLYRNLSEFDGSRGGFTLKILAVDSLGFYKEDWLTIFITQSEPLRDADGNKTYLRFIDKTNYDKNDPEIRNKVNASYMSSGRKERSLRSGGLSDNSVWYMDEELRDAFAESQKESAGLEIKVPIG